LFDRWKTASAAYVKKARVRVARAISVPDGDRDGLHDQQLIEFRDELRNEWAWRFDDMRRTLHRDTVTRVGSFA
jgi:hypothetical protein